MNQSQTSLDLLYKNNIPSVITGNAYADLTLNVVSDRPLTQVKAIQNSWKKKQEEAKTKC